MIKEFNLSKKIVKADNKKRDNGFIFTKDIQRFINLIQAKALIDWKGQNEFSDWLKKRVGEDFK